MQAAFGAKSSSIITIGTEYRGISWRLVFKLKDLSSTSHHNNLCVEIRRALKSPSVSYVMGDSDLFVFSFTQYGGRLDVG